jgi:putative transcriptional regulator
MIKVDKGILLVAEPFMKDVNFQRAVVLLCEHQDSGSFGITINKPTDKLVADYMDGIGNYTLPLYDGGPVGKDHIHFLHKLPSHISNSTWVGEETYWGGDLEAAKFVINSGLGNDSNIRFYLGYSGWGEQQLDEEMDEKSWLTVPSSGRLVFHQNKTIIWKEAVRAMGNEYTPLLNYPLDPSFN